MHISSLLMAGVSISVMKGVMAFFIIFLFIFGALFMFSPDALAKMNQWGNRVLFQPRDSIPRSTLVGGMLIFLGIVMLVILFMLKAKVGG